MRLKIKYFKYDLEIKYLYLLRTLKRINIPNMNAIDIFDEKIKTAKTIAFIKKKLDLVESNFSIK